MKKYKIVYTPSIYPEDRFSAYYRKFIFWFPIGDSVISEDEAMKLIDQHKKGHTIYVD